MSSQRSVAPPLTASPLPGSPQRRHGDRASSVRPSAAAGGGYSRFVRLARTMLPLFAAGLLGLVVAWPHLRHWVEPVRVTQGSGSEAAEPPQMVAPRYFGIDNLNRPYSITGRSGVPNTTNGEVFSLDDPEAEITLENGNWVTVRAAHGEIDRQRRTVRLHGNVSVFRDDGYTFSTDEAAVDLNSRLTWGDRPIEGHGPQLEITAEGFRIEGQGSTVVFTGRTRVVLRRPQPAAGSDPSPTQTPAGSDQGHEQQPEAPR